MNQKERIVILGSLSLILLCLVVFYALKSGQLSNKLDYEKFEREIDKYCYLKLDGISWEWRGCSPECKLKDGTTKMLPHHR